MSLLCNYFLLFSVFLKYNHFYADSSLLVCMLKIRVKTWKVKLEKCLWFYISFLLLFCSSLFSTTNTHYIVNMRKILLAERNILGVNWCKKKYNKVNFYHHGRAQFLLYERVLWVEVDTNLCAGEATLNPTSNEVENRHVDQCLLENAMSLCLSKLLFRGATGSVHTCGSHLNTFFYHLIVKPCYGCTSFSHYFKKMS